MANDDHDLMTFAVASHLAAIHSADEAQIWEAARYLVESGSDLREVFVNPSVAARALGGEASYPGPE